MWQDLAVDFIFLIIPIVLAGGWFLWRRRRLLNLSSISQKRGLTIYLSRLQIVPSGAVGFDGMPRSFTGPAVTAAEAAASTVLGSVFEYLIPGP
jgi:hypothetical protein